MPKKVKKTKEEKIVAKPVDNNARLIAVKIAMQQITKQFGEGAIMHMGSDRVSEKIPVISSGSIVS